MADTAVEELVGVLPAGLPAAGPVQEYIIPPVDELPFKVTVALEQVMVGDEPALAFGCVVFVLTVTDAVFVQPFDGLVTVKV